MAEWNQINVDHVAFKKAVRSGNWYAVEEFLVCHPDYAGLQITSLGQTALHIAIKAGHKHIVEKLVAQMSEEELEVKNKFGNTALDDIVFKGNYQMAVCMLRKNVNLVSIKNSVNQLPVVMAILYGHIKLARYLYSLTPEEDLKPEKGKDGATLCCLAIYKGNLGNNSLSNYFLASISDDI
jgi:ankyrin repeat protein